MATFTIAASETALRNAIANAAAGDIITFSSSGTITLTGGELVIDKALTIDAGGNDITIDADGNSRVFNIDDGTSTEVDVVLEGITITGGSSTGDGGGIFNAEDLTITDSTISNNEATGSFADGGGIFNDHNGILTITDSIITGNFADDNGGGIYNNDLGSMEISGSTIDGNTSNFDGGGLFNFGDATITDTTISNNQALSDIADGGGIAVFDDIEIINSTITGNSAGDDGGGVYIKDFVGGKVPTATISGTTIDNNTAASDGGGVFNFGEAIITDSTITQNEAQDKDGTGGGGGIASFGSTSTTSTTVTSSFVAGNADNSDVVFVTGTENSFISGDNNQVGKGNAIGAFNLTNDETGIMPGVTITETGDSTDITEGGATDTYSVVLDSQPTDDVTVTIAPDGESTTDVMELTFNSSNWNVAQTVTVTAEDDNLVEPDHTSTISHTVSGAIEYDGLTVDDVVANITDNDTAGVTITESGGSTAVVEADDLSEDGATDTYTVVLDAQPTSLVSINLGPVDGQALFTPNILIFDENNWDTPQTVTVFATPDNLVENNHIGTISHTVSSTGDPNFDGLVVDNVTVNITDNDFMNPNNPVLGSSGDDIPLNGTPDADNINGRGGNDDIFGFAGNDTLAGSGGEDTLRGQAGDDELSGGNLADSLLGGIGQDTLTGDGGADTLRGASGQDSLLGGNGADLLVGGDDNDTLDGGAGVDRLRGGDGADSFVLRSGDGNDIILDYDNGTDNFLLEGIGFDELQFVQSSVNTLIQYTNPLTGTENLATVNNVDAAVLANSSSDFLTI